MDRVPSLGRGKVEIGCGKEMSGGIALGTSRSCREQMPGLEEKDNSTAQARRVGVAQLTAGNIGVTKGDANQPRLRHTVLFRGSRRSVWM